MSFQKGMKMKIKGYGTGTFVKETNKGAIIAFDQAGGLELEFAMELIEGESFALESKRDSAPHITRKLANADREAIEALRFGLVPRSYIEDLTIGFEDLKEWVLGWFPEANQGEMSASEVSGPFGTGKSHTMEVIRHLANKNGYLTANVEVDGQNISLADPAKLLNALWKTLSGESFQSATPLLDLYIKFINQGNPIPEDITTKIKDNLKAIRYLKVQGQLDKFSHLIEGLISNSEEYTASYVNNSIEQEIRNFRNQGYAFRPLIGIKTDERAIDFVQAIAGNALLSRILGFKGLVITIDEFEVEHNLDRIRLNRVSELLTVLTNYFAGRGQFPKAPLALFLASVGQEGNVGDNLIKYMIEKTNGGFYALSPWANEQLILLAQKIHKLYCKSYAIDSLFNVSVAYATEKILQDKGFNDSGLIRAFIKTYVSLLDLQYGPPEVYHEAG